MHIPDGYLGPATYGTLFGATIPFWGIASWKLNRTLKSRQAPYLALGAAFSFVIMMFNIPMPGGTTGHATGSALVAILIGPWATIIAVSVALAIQALLFGDGGITALGANCFNMAIAGGLTGWFVYRVVAAGSRIDSRRRMLAAGLAGYASLNVSALLAAIELGLQPLFERSATGQPLYAPYPLSVTIPSIMSGHLLIFGVLEAIVTMLVLRYIRKSDSRLLELNQ